VQAALRKEEANHKDKANQVQAALTAMQVCCRKIHCTVTAWFSLLKFWFFYCGSLVVPGKTPRRHEARESGNSKTGLASSKSDRTLIYQSLY
jgi:hypothetical protein